MKLAPLGLLWLLAVSLAAQNAIPAGTTLPLQLDTGLNAAKLAPGHAVRATVMQNIPGTPIRRGAHVLGSVVSVTPSTLVFRFDTVANHGKRFPLVANLRALASLLEVEEAQIPEGGADRALPPDQRSHEQIGGDIVYPWDGPVARGLDVVGEPTPYGALARPTANPPCHGAADGNPRPQALWLFSTDACGLYGYSNLTIDHFGRTDPVGTIRLSAKSGKLYIRSGSGLLLRVHGS
ncbi:MAG: hypothetical protein ACLGXA_18830 [Acidobacteriota bacterium]